MIRDLTPPPEDHDGKRFIAHAGQVWRRASVGWWPIDDVTAARLLALLRLDAANGADWFRDHARQGADDLAEAIHAIEDARDVETDLATLQLETQP